MGTYEIERAQRDEVIQNLKREGVRRGYSGDTLSFFIVDGLRVFDRQKQELAKQKHELEKQKHELEKQKHELEKQKHELEKQKHELEMRKMDAALETKRLEVGGQRLALERRKLELKERSKKNELEDLIEIEEKNLLRDKMLVERKYFGRHVVIDTEWQKLEHAAQGRIWKFERESWIEIEKRRQQLDKMQVELENRAEANNRLIQEIESQYYGGRPFQPSLVLQNLRATAIECFQRTNNDSHEADNFQTTSQQTTNTMEIGDGENEKDDVEDSSADDDGEEKKERDSKAGSETHHLPEKEPLVESKTESETQQKNEEEEAKVEVEKTELMVEEKPPEKIWIEQIQGHADDFEPALPQPRNSIDNKDDEDEENDVTTSSADPNEKETNEQNGTTESQTYQHPRENPVVDRMTEKDAQTKQEAEGNARSKEENKELTAEKNQTEKVRLKMIQEEGDLSLANNLNMTKCVESGSESTIEKMTPKIEEAVKHFRKSIKSKMKLYEESKYYFAGRDRAKRHWKMLVATRRKTKRKRHRMHFGAPTTVEGRHTVDKEKGKRTRKLYSSHWVTVDEPDIEVASGNKSKQRKKRQRKLHYRQLVTSTIVYGLQPNSM